MAIRFFASRDRLGVQAISGFRAFWLARRPVQVGIAAVGGAEVADGKGVAVGVGG